MYKKEIDEEEKNGRKVKSMYVLGKQWSKSEANCSFNCIWMN